MTVEHRVVATGRGVVIDRWLGIAAIEVAGPYRRRGLARQVTHALQTWGASHGATHCYLQVATTSTAALALCTALGLAHHHTYRQRTAAEPP